LLAVAYARCLWSLLQDERSRRAVEMSELFADGQVTQGEMTRASEDAWEVFYDIRDRLGSGWPMEAAAVAMFAAWDPAGWQGTSLGAAYRVVERLHKAHMFHGLPHAHAEAVLTDLVLYTDIVRDIFGNPFRPVTFSPQWRTDTAIALARQMYDSREFSAMPILADALQDAGCDNEVILSHCRGPGPHVRGCWVVDLVLGKE
jgi:hypothetical protein